MSAYWPFIVIGLFTGSIYALGALGLVLTYKTTGVFNFAYGGVAMFCAYIYWQLHDTWHITAWLALPVLVLVAAPVIGLLFEVLFRPLAGLTAEIPIVVCLALLALTQVGAQLIWKGQQVGLQAVIPTSTFRLSSFHVGWDQLGTLVIALLMAAGMWWLLRHTRFGTATRAVVDNGDLASIIGVNGDGVRRAAWVLSSMFAGVIGVLLAARFGIDPNSLVLIVLASMTPAVFGRLVSFPWAFGGALILGVFQSVLAKWSSSGTLANIKSSIPWLLLFVLLIVLGSQLKEAGLSVSRLTGAPAIGASPVIESEASNRRRRLPPSVLVALGAFAAAVFLPAMINRSYLFDTTQGVLIALVAVSLVVLTGWAGQISLAQFSFAGVGAYAVGHLAGAHGQNFVVAALSGMGIALGLGVVLGLPSLRLKGLYLALATFAFALIMDGIVFNSVAIGGSLSGINASRPRIAGISFTSTTSFYELSLWVLGAVLLAAYLLRLGPIGRRLRILRDSPLAASTLGVNLTVTKLVTFAVCGAVAALGGALYGSYVQSVTPTDFMWPTSIALLLYVVFAGRALLTGAVVAGAIAMIPAFFPNPTIHNYIQLGVALGVIGLGRNPEGTVALSVQEAMRTFTVLRPRPRRQLDLEPLVRPRRVEVGSSV
jgi:branched-chain amino acid transport system permease protein